jgi:hypothetical protein
VITKKVIVQLILMNNMPTVNYSNFSIRGFHFFIFLFLKTSFTRNIIYSSTYTISGTSQIIEKGPQDQQKTWKCPTPPKNLIRHYLVAFLMKILKRNTIQWRVKLNHLVLLLNGNRLKKSTHSIIYWNSFPMNIMFSDEAA